MFVHKFKYGDNLFFMVSDNSDIPDTTFNLTIKNWAGVSPEENQIVIDVLRMLGKVPFKKIVKETKEPEETGKKKSSIADLLRIISQKTGEQE